MASADELGRNTAVVVQSPEPEYWTPLRRELLAWFSRNAIPLGELYEGALQILYSPTFPAKSRFVAHAMREISNRLPDTLGPRLIARTDYPKHCDEILRLWKRAQFPLDGSLPTAPPGRATGPDPVIEVSVELCRSIATLVVGHANSKETNEEKAARLFRSLTAGEEATSDVPAAIIAEWLRLTVWAVSVSHGKLSDDQELRQRFELFEAALGGLVRAFFSTTTELDEILESANS